MDTRWKVAGTATGLLGLLTVGYWVFQSQTEEGTSATTGQAMGTDYPPNILLIVADDLGVDKVDSYADDASTDYRANAQYLPQTPVMDSLATSGVRFTDAWANPSCTPTRAALYTGHHGFRTGMGNPTGRSGQEDMDPDQITVADMLNEAGYRSAIFGKWHVGEGERPGEWSDIQSWAQYLDTPYQVSPGPMQMGYTMFIGDLEGKLDHSPFTGYTDWMRIEVRKPGGVVTAVATAETDYVTRVTTDDALEWINRQPGRWMATLGYHSPHTPLENPPADCVYGEAAAEGNSTDTFRQMVECLDIEIGRLLDGIEDLDDTLIVVVGDNGTQIGVHEDVFDDGRGKGTLYESGVRVPLIMADGRTWMAEHQPGFVRSQDWRTSPRHIVDPGSEVADPVHVVDIAATLVDLAGADPSQAVDGQSFAPLLHDTNDPIPTHVYTEQFSAGGTGTAALRVGDDKLIIQVMPGDGGTCRGSFELYDLLSDRFENNDRLAGNEPDTETRDALLDTLEGVIEPGSWLDVPNC